MNIFKGRVEREGDRFRFLGEANAALAFDLPELWVKFVAPCEGRTVYFGARPEDIGSRQAVGRESPPVIASLVEVVEPMGSETYLYLKSGTAPFIARVESHMRVSVGDRLELPVLIEKAHLFDAESENIIV